MLSPGPGSSCDICFELFDLERRAPTSIACGHIFCNSCIAQITGVCPICRKPFDMRTCTKLRVDIEEPGCSSEDFKAAQKLQQKLSSIVQEGISEQPLRQLLQETKSFLHTQPRNLHKDLRIFSRMLSYLAEIKANLRTRNSEVDGLTGEVSRLKDEKASLRKQVAEVEESRRYERETALAVETSLRDHCTQSIEVYKTTLQLYNKVAAENAELMLKLSNLLTSSKQADAHHPDSILPANSSDPSFFSPAVDEKVLRRVGIQDPNASYLISPLPQFTSLPTIAGSILPLPELAEDDEDEEDSNEDDDDEVTTPDSVHHPAQLRDSKDRIRVPEVPTLPPPRQLGKMYHEPSGLSRTAPFREHYGRARSRSNPSQPTSRSQSRSQSPFGSNMSSTPPRSPPPHSNVVMAQPQVSYQVSPREAFGSSPAVPQQVLRSRLQDILSDSTTSASLPNMTSSYFPQSFMSRDAGNPRESRGSPPSRSDSSMSNGKTLIPPQHSSSDNFSHLLASGSQTASKPGPSVSPILQAQPYNGAPRISTASAEAKKLEEERRRKKEERNQSQSQDTYADIDRDRWPKATTSSASAALAVPVPTSSASHAARRDQQGYSNPLSQNSSSNPSLKRGLSFSGGSGPYGKPSTSAVPSGYEPPLTHHARHPNPSTSTASANSSTKSNSVPTLPSSSTGIYA